MDENIPSDWTLKDLESLSSLITKGTTPTSYGHNYTDSGVKFIRVENIAANGQLQETDLKYINKNADEDLKRSRLQTGDLLISIAGAIGRTALVKETNLPANTNQAVGIVRFNAKPICHEFICYSVAGPIVAEQIEDLQAGLAQINLNLQQLGSLEIPYPPLPEQKKIATILTSVDTVIEKTQAQIDKLNDLKTGMMQELLTKGIGPDGKPHTEFKDSAVGRIPVGWDVLSLSQLVKGSRPITYGIVQTGQDTPEGVPCVRVVDMMSPYINPSQLITTTPKISQQYQRTVLEEGDIMFALRGNIGHVRIVPKQLVGANLTRGIALISPKNLVLPDFLYWAIQSTKVKEKIAEAVNGSALQEIPLGNLRKIPIPVPPKHEQIEITTKLKAFEELLERQVLRNSSVNKIKKALMQDLLTGKVRTTPDPEPTPAD